MKSSITLLGVLLLVAGVLTLSYSGFTYTKREKIIEIGELSVTAEHPKTVYFPPLLGGLCLVTGLALVVVGRK